MTFPADPPGDAADRGADRVTNPGVLADTTIVTLTPADLAPPPPVQGSGRTVVRNRHTGDHSEIVGVRWHSRFGHMDLMLSGENWDNERDCGWTPEELAEHWEVVGPD